MILRFCAKILENTLFEVSLHQVPILYQTVSNRVLKYFMAFYFNLLKKINKQMFVYNCGTSIKIIVRHIDLKGIFNFTFKIEIKG